MKGLLFLLFLSPLTLICQMIDFTHLSLHLKFVVSRSQVQGTVFLSFINDGFVDSIYLNGIKMNYHFVQLNGNSIKYGFNDKGIWILPKSGELKDSNVIFIGYDCQPYKGIYFVGWKDETDLGRKQIWTQGQGIDHRYWIPHRDEQTDKVITELFIYFDRNYEVVSNGELLSQKKLDSNLQVWHYKMDKPMSSYLITVAIGKYCNIRTIGKDGTLLTQYFYPDRADDYHWYYAHNEEIYNLMTEEIGVPYPWKNYKQVPVQDFHHGAMENTTTTIFGDFFMIDSIAANDRNYTYVNAHELAHQWFGNYITAQNGDHHWLHEGFATYYQWLSEHNLYGKDLFDWKRWKAAEMIFAVSKTNSYPLVSRNAGSARFYQKGAWVLYMLENLLGEETYRQSIQYYLGKYALGVVTTEDLRQSILEVSGIDISSFLNQWVKQPGEPHLKIKGSVSKNQLQLSIWQNRDSASQVFKLDLPLTIFYKDGSNEEHVLQAGSDSGYFTLPLDDSKELGYWTVNSNMSILALHKEEKPLEFWQAQALLAPDLLDRYIAVKALVQFELSEKEELLTAIVENPEEHFAVRAETLRQAMKGSEKLALKLLRLALNSVDVQLQKEAIYLMGDFKEEFKEELITLRKGRSYELREKVIQLLVDMEHPQNNQWLYDSIYTEQPGIPGRKVEITVLTYQALLYQNDEALQKLIFRLSPAFDFLTRMNAIDALMNLNFYDTSMNSYLFSALFSSNQRLSSKAKTMLQGYFDKPELKEVLLDAYIEEHKEEWEEYQLKMVKELEKQEESRRKAGGFKLRS